MDSDYAKIVVTTILAILGWLTAHYFTAKRSIAAKRRDVTLEHLINAYRVLTNDVSHRHLDSGGHEKLENLLSDIQLFGSAEQVKLARRLVDEVASGKSFELDPLINSLRDDLRNQLQLETVSGNVKWLRFEGSEQRKVNSKSR